MFTSCLVQCLSLYLTGESLVTFGVGGQCIAAYCELPAVCYMISHQSRCRENTVALETNVSGIWLSTQYSQVIIFHSILMIMADWWSVSCLQGKNSFSKHSISSCRHKQIPGQEVKCLEWLMASLMLKKCNISCFMSVLLTWTNQIVFGRFQNTRREVWFTLICCFFFKLRLVESNSCASPETASSSFSVNFVVTDSWPTLWLKQRHSNTRKDWGKSCFAVTLV